MREWIVSDEDFAGDSFYYGSALIRCGDCEYYSADSRSCNAHDCPGDILYPNDYCSWGSRKEHSDD